MLFMFANQDETLYIINKYLNELLLMMRKELKIFTLCNQFFLLMNDFDTSGGRMTFAASRYHEILIEVRGISKYVY